MLFGMQRYTIGNVADLGKCKVLQATEKALRVRLLEAFASDEDEMWVPKKCLVQGNQCFEMGDVGTCLVSYSWWEGRNKQAKTKFTTDWTPPKLPRSLRKD